MHLINYNFIICIIYISIYAFTIYIDVSECNTINIKCIDVCCYRNTSRDTPTVELLEPFYYLCVTTSITTRRRVIFINARNSTYIYKCISGNVKKDIPSITFTNTQIYTHSIIHDIMQ